MLPTLQLLYTLSCTCPSFEEDTSATATCATHGAPERTAGLDLYRALCGGSGMPLYQRTIPCAAGQHVSFDAGPLCATWWALPVDSAGNRGEMGCARGATVGIPAVSVEQTQELARQGLLYDIAGRRVQRVERSGVYFVRQPWGARRALLIR